MVRITFRTLCSVFCTVMIGSLLVCGNANAQEVGSTELGRFSIARLHYSGGGDWYANQSSLPNLLAELQREHGFTSYVAILPVFNSLLTDYKMGAVHNKVYSLAQPYEEFSVIDLVKPFASINPDPSYYSYDSVHMKAEGHDALAKLLVPLVRQTAKKRNAR